MKKILAIGIAIAMMAAFTPLAIGDDSQVITITLDPNSVASITCNQTEFDLTGTSAIGGSYHTGNEWGNITNDGVISVSVAVNASNTSAWTLGQSAAHNTFTLAIDGGQMNVEPLLGNTPKTYYNNLGAGSTQTFNVSINMPTSSSTNTPQVLHLTFVATVL